MTPTSVALAVVSFITVVMLYGYLVVFLSHGEIPLSSGHSTAKKPIDAYGFGPRKQRIVIDVDPWTIDPKDKIFANMTWSDVDGVHDQTIGIEIKGSTERRKLNYAIEIWGPEDDDTPCTSIETCEDDKATLFEFGEKYEDFVLRGGEHEPTLVRDILANDIQGNILEHTLVELLFRHPHGRVTYEGTYILFTAIQRRVLDKRLHWDSSGKAKCDNVEDASMIAEYTIQVGSRKAPCEEFDLDVKMRYPKCDMDECLHDRLHTYFSVLNLQNETVVPLDMDSFVSTYLAEMLLREDDFPYTSQYFFLTPDDVLVAGPAWDYDSTFWRVAPVEGWDLYDLQYYERGAIPLWLHLGQHREFIDAVNQVRVATVATNRQKTRDIIDTRIAQSRAGHFDRNNQRWKSYQNADSRAQQMVEAVYNKEGRTKSTMEEELAFMKSRVDARSDWMSAHPVEPFGVRVFELTLYLTLLFVPLFIMVIALIGLCIYKCKQK